MNALKIKLKINGQEKTFVATEIKGRMLRKAVEFQQLKNMSEDSFGVDELDSIIAYVVEVFGGQFTIDDVYDGLDVRDLMPEMMRCINEVMARFYEKMNSLPNGAPANH